MITIWSVEEEKIVPMLGLQPPVLAEDKLASAKLRVENTLHIRRGIPPRKVREGEHILKIIKMKKPESNLTRQGVCLTV